MSAEDANETLNLNGDFFTGNGDGYRLDLLASEYNAAKFIKLFDQVSDYYIFSEAARGMSISFTLYNFRNDFWTSNHVFFEYGINNQVLQSIVRSYPFRPSFYETDSEKKMLLIDVVRVGFTCVTLIIILIWKVSIRL